MHDWLSIPVVSYGLILITCAIVFPLILGIAARILLFRPDADDPRNAPRGARDGQTVSEMHPKTPEPGPLIEKPWPNF